MSVVGFNHFDEEAQDCVPGPMLGIDMTTKQMDKQGRPVADLYIAEGTGETAIYLTLEELRAHINRCHEVLREMKWEIAPLALVRNNSFSLGHFQWKDLRDKDKPALCGFHPPEDGWQLDPLVEVHLTHRYCKRCLARYQQSIQTTRK